MVGLPGGDCAPGPERLSNRHRIQGIHAPPFPIPAHGDRSAIGHRGAHAATTPFRWPRFGARLAPNRIREDIMPKIQAEALRVLGR
ncbi:MAG: hypothetical protein AAGC69_23600, partial [Paracraurococcus sp.]